LVAALNVRSQHVDNALLASLAPEALRQLLPVMMPVRLEKGDVLAQQDAPVRAAYFPVSGVISFLSVLGDGRQVEVGIVGSDGVAGAPVFDQTHSPVAAVVQLPGEAFRIDRESQARALELAPDLHRLMLEYSASLLAMTVQSSACSRFHSAHHRLARWLLMFHDRVPGDEIPVTQAYAADLLGVYRPTVTNAAKVLEEAGAIGGSRGRFRVLDRTALEAAACECYERMQRRFDEGTVDTP
jgi:CRP-like cAMP-binding protein